MVSQFGYVTFVHVLEVCCNWFKSWAAWIFCLTIGDYYQRTCSSQLPVLEVLDWLCFWTFTCYISLYSWSNTLYWMQVSEVARIALSLMSLVYLQSNILGELVLFVFLWNLPCWFCGHVIGSSCFLMVYNSAYFLSSWLVLFDSLNMDYWRLVGLLNMSGFGLFCLVWVFLWWLCWFWWCTWTWAWSLEWFAFWSLCFGLLFASGLPITVTIGDYFLDFFF